MVFLLHVDLQICNITINIILYWHKIRLSEFLFFALSLQTPFNVAYKLFSGFFKITNCIIFKHSFKLEKTKIIENIKWVIDIFTAFLNLRQY